MCTRYIPDALKYLRVPTRCTEIAVASDVPGLSCRLEWSVVAWPWPWPWVDVGGTRQTETLLTVHRPSHLRHPPPTTHHPLSAITRRSAPDHTRHCTPSCPLSLLDPSPSLGPPFVMPPRARARDEGGGGRGHRNTAWARVVSSVLPVLMGVWQDLEYLGYFQHRTCRSLLYLQRRGKLKGQNRASQVNRLGALAKVFFGRT